MRYLSLLLASSISVFGCVEQPTSSVPTATPTVTAASRLAAPSPRPLPTVAATPVAQASALPAPVPEDAKLAVEGEGLRWFLPPNGSAQPIPFGTTEAAVLSSLESVRGPAGTGTNRSCGAGPVQYASWPDGLSLVFQRGVFVGWSLDGRAEDALSTANGVGPGSTRAELDGSYGAVRVERSTLGVEFSAGGVQGLLDGPGRRAKITDLWAGVNCAAR